MHILLKVCTTHCTLCDGISYDVYSLKSLYDSLYNDKMLSSYMYVCSFLLSVTVPMLFFLLFLLFPCASVWVSTRARVPRFQRPRWVMLSGSCLGSAFFNVCARDLLCMNFIISPFDQQMSPHFIYLAMLMLQMSV